MLWARPDSFHPLQAVAEDWKNRYRGAPVRLATEGHYHVDRSRPHGRAFPRALTRVRVNRQQIACAPPHVMDNRSIASILDRGIRAFAMHKSEVSRLIRLIRRYRRRNRLTRSYCQRDRRGFADRTVESLGDVEDSP